MDLTIITSNSPALKEALRIAREQEQEQEEAEAIVVGGKRKAVTAIEPNKKIRSTIDNIPLDASSKAIADEPGFHLIQHRFNLTTVESDQAFVQLLSERGAGEANDLGSVQLNIIAKKGWSPYTDYLIVVNNAQGVSLLHLDPIEYSRRGIKTKMGGGGLVEALVYLARKGQVESGIILTATLSASASSATLPIFYLDVAVQIKSPFYALEEVGAAKRIIFQHLFPPLSQPVQMSVESFYAALRRSPRTIDGVPVRSSMPVVESEEEREKRERREAKGKGKAIEETIVEDGLELGEEDILLRAEGLEATLMPFQSRTVRWMLRREGKIALMKQVEDEVMENDIVAAPDALYADDVDDAHAVEDARLAHEHANGQESPEIHFHLVDVPEADRREIARGPLWRSIDLDLVSPLGERQSFWINDITTKLSLDDPAMNVSEGEGGASGLVAEEMGLGKSIEAIALILLHQQPERNLLPTYHDADLDCDIQPTSISLIISPLAISGQWFEEFKRHAPSLRVLNYASLSQIKNLTAAQISAQYDVIITTFDALRKEVVLARKPHQRALRSKPEERMKYKRSLLVQFSFLRVLMDEVQMLGESVGPAAECAALIPRKYSWAISGTPIKYKVEDVQSLLRFLKVNEIGANKFYLNRLLNDQETFDRLIGTLGERTTKAHVQNELVLPPQSRFLVPVEFSDVEKYFYQARYTEALEDLDLDAEGYPRKRGWTVNKSLMNSLLFSLRQLCSHPANGAVNKRVLGNVIGTIEEVLEVMRSQATNTLQSEIRELWASRSKSGQLMCWEEEECEGLESALEIFGAVIEKTQPVANEIVAAMVECHEELKRERTLRNRLGSVDSMGSGVAGALAILEDDNSSATAMLSDIERGLVAKTSALRSRLRELLLVQHGAHFFAGSAWHILGKFSELEDGAYAQADELRNVLLKPYETIVLKATKRCVAAIKEREAKSPLDLEILFSNERPGIAGVNLWTTIEDTIEALNGFAELIIQQRDVLLQVIVSPVSISGKATGDEYAERAETQEKGNIYLESFSTLVSEWRYMVTGNRSALDDFSAVAPASKKSEWAAQDGSKRARKEVGEAKKRAKVVHPVAPTLEAGYSPADILAYELDQERIKARGAGAIMSLKALIQKCKEVSDGVKSGVERAIIEQENARLRKIIIDKEKILERLNVELGDITRTFNTRITYFRQLQIISDSVVDPPFHSKKFKGVTVELRERFLQEEKLERSIGVKTSQRRYLENLQASREETQEDCVICTDVIKKGVLTKCGHTFCHACFSKWLSHNPVCPTCKTPLKPSKDYTTTLVEEPKVKEVEREKEKPKVPVGFGSIATPELTILDAETIVKIKGMDAAAPLSSKSCFIAKHVKYLRSIDPTAKIVILSAWTESLSILMRTFDKNSIEYVRLEGGGKKNAAVKKFINDPDISVFLLHSLSQGAGLTLVCASYVFLMEPLLHGSVENQAVGRVHRIGQTRTTTVFQYYIQDTVDQRVAELRARQGTSLFLAARGDTTTTKTTKQESTSRAAIISEVIDDEDDIATLLLDPQHLAALQRSLFPQTD